MKSNTNKRMVHTHSVIDQAIYEFDSTTLNNIFKTKKVSAITNCPHTDKKHYAKGMCGYCYNVHGRTNKAYNCEHTDKNIYARGLCRNCYNRLITSRQKIFKIEKVVRTQLSEEKIEWFNLNYVAYSVPYTYNSFYPIIQFKLIFLKSI